MCTEGWCCWAWLEHATARSEVRDDASQQLAETSTPILRRNSLLSDFGACLPPMPSKPKLPRSVPRFFKNVGKRDPAFFPTVMPVDPDAYELATSRDEEEDDDLVVVAYHENGVTFRGMGLTVMKLAFYLRRRDAESIMSSALKIQAPSKGQHEKGLSEEQFNSDVTRILRERNLMPVLRVVPETKMSSKEDSAFSPVPGFRSFVEDLRNKVIKYDPRAKPTDKDFYDPEWLRRTQDNATQAVNAVMDLVPDDLQQGMILTFDVRDREQVFINEPERQTSPSTCASDVLIHVDREHIKSCKRTSKLAATNVKTPKRQTFQMEGHSAQLFAEMWKNIWLQDYTQHAATGSTRGLATKGWMPMQLRGLRESFAQILTQTKLVLFSEAIYRTASQDSIDSFHSCASVPELSFGGQTSTRIFAWPGCWRRRHVLSF